MELLQVVDVNENLYAPYFPDFALRGSVKENSRAGTSVLTVSAKDDDRGRDGALRYSIKGGNGLGTFTIDEDTGATAFNQENTCLPCNFSLRVFYISDLYYWVFSTLIGNVALFLSVEDEEKLRSSQTLLWAPCIHYRNEDSMTAALSGPRAAQRGRTPPRCRHNIDQDFPATAATF